MPLPPQHPFHDDAGELRRRWRLRGRGASIVWSYHTAATLTSWSVVKDSTTGRWALTAMIDRATPFYLRQVPLLFTAPRLGGFWCWPLLEPPRVLDERRLLATLGPPEH
jgi:hypothetical protein